MLSVLRRSGLPRSRLWNQALAARIRRSASTIAESSIDVEQNSQKGRLLVATKALKPGDTVLAESPLVVWNEVGRCAVCLAPQQVSSSRSNHSNHSRWATCSPACRSEADERYGFDLIGLHDVTVEDEAQLQQLARKGAVGMQRKHPRLAARVLAGWIYGRVLAGKSDGSELHDLQYLLDLMHMRLPEDDIEPFYDAFCSTVAARLVKLASVTRDDARKIVDRMVTPELFYRVTGTMHLNTHTIYGFKDKATAIAHDEERIGTAVFHIGSFFNHSCVPNVELRSQSFPLQDNQRMHRFVAIRPIAEGEECTIAYTDPDRPDDERKAYLRYNYGFECDCPKCT